MPVRGDDGESAVAEHAWENHHPIHCSGVGTNFGLGGGQGVLGGVGLGLYNNQHDIYYNMEPDYWGGQAPLLDYWGGQCPPPPPPPPAPPGSYSTALGGRRPQCWTIIWQRTGAVGEGGPAHPDDMIRGGLEVPGCWTAVMRRQGGRSNPH